MTTTPVSPLSDQPLREVGPIRAGQQLQGRYNLLNRLAKGGMGEVWRARDTRTGMLVAAKVLRPELTGEEISLSRLRIEAQNAMRARHPNIAAVLDSGESNGQGWIVMELVQGNPLTDYVGNGKRLPAVDLVPILCQTAWALEGAAQAGIVHRDIKPANIMVRSDGLVKLTDFGISYAAGQVNLTAVGMVMGTAQYLAPEQAMGSVATPAGDLYSLGVIAYEALAGYRPFTGKSVVDIAMAHVNDEVPPLPDDVPPLLAEVVYGLLEKDPDKRLTSGTALVRALSRVGEQIGASTAPKPLEKPKQSATPKPPVKNSAAPEFVVSAPANLPRRLENNAASVPRRIESFSPPAKNSGSRQVPHRPALKDERADTPSAPAPPPRSAASAGQQPQWKAVPSRKIRVSSPPPLPPRGSSSVGLWVIAGLVALTIILIFVAILRGTDRTTNVQGDGLPGAVALADLEVQLWPTPTRVF